MTDDERCPCGRPVPYEGCCGRLHSGGRAATAEHVMRARFSAFARGDTEYLATSWHSSTRPAHVRVDAGQRWIELVVEATTAGGMLDAEGTVTFDAHWRRGEHAGVLHEQSRFAREDGRWVYVGPA